MLPQYLYRPDDGERFTLQEDGLYTMDSSKMSIAYRFPYELLIGKGFLEYKPSP